MIVILFFHIQIFISLPFQMLSKKFSANLIKFQVFLTGLITLVQFIWKSEVNQCMLQLNLLHWATTMLLLLMKIYLQKIGTFVHLRQWSNALFSETITTTSQLNKKNTSATNCVQRRDASVVHVNHILPFE